MDKKEIFQAAAKRVVAGKDRFSCLAVENATRKADCDAEGVLRNEYEKLYSRNNDDYLFVSDFEDGETRQAARFHRSLALLLAGEVLSD